MAAEPGKAPALLLSLVLALLPGSAFAADTLRAFTSDGCSLFPDGSPADPNKWCDCCFRHDIAYWKGGTTGERLQADQTLRDCVQERTGNSALAKMMFDGVRLGGHPAFPNWYRWGYGWRYGRGYAPLTAVETGQAQGLLEQYFRDHPDGYCKRDRGPGEERTISSPTRSLPR